MIDHELHATWRARLEEQQVSGLSAAAWCREQGIPDHQFYYWRKVRIGNRHSISG